jgi:hypothetical protein
MMQIWSAPPRELPNTIRLLSGDQAELVTALDRVEAEEMGEGTHERCHELAHKLAAVDEGGLR